MSVVAVSWLALHLAPPGEMGTWVAVCLAAAVVPGLLVTLFWGRRLGSLSAVTLGLRDAELRALTLGAVPVAYLLGCLDVRLFAVLLAISSLLRPWGSACRYTMLTQLLPEEDQPAGNALLSTIVEFGSLMGPPLAALLIAVSGPVASIAVDAATFVVLAGTYRMARSHLAIRPVDAGRKPAEATTGNEPSAAAAVLRQPAVAGLLLLTMAFFGLYGPVDVALPVHVARDMGAPASLLAVYVTVFGIGALLGGFASAWMQRISLWPLTTGVVVGWGVCLLPLGLGAPEALSLVAFGVGAFLYSPYLAVSTTLLQRATPEALLSHVLALRASLVNFAVPLGAVLAGPLLAGVGARRVILASALATVTLGVVAALAVAIFPRLVGGTADAAPPAFTPEPRGDRSPPVADDLQLESEEA